MFCIGICQNYPDFLARIISAALTESGRPVFYCDGKVIQIPKKDATRVTILLSSEPYDSEIPFDLCVYEPNFSKTAPTCYASLAIIPDTLRPVQFQGAQHVITYGLCQKNTVTVSSLVGEDLVIAIQREIPTLLGETVDAQEFHVKFSQFGDINDTLAIVSTLLVSGVSPEKISELSKQ